jgi:hypothetical protein
MINDLDIAEVVSKGTNSLVQDAVTDVEEWSTANRLTLNAEKCKELRIDFKLVKQPFDSVHLWMANPCP